MPLINRAVFDLAFLSPGVTPPAGASFGPNNSANNFISNGSRNATADIIMDGVSTVNYERNSGIQLALYTPSVDAIQEFKVQKLNSSAEIGFSGATVMNVVFRSGTNDFHGRAYYFRRNSAFERTGQGRGEPLRDVVKRERLRDRNQDSSVSTPARQRGGSAANGSRPVHS